MNGCYTPDDRVVTSIVNWGDPVEGVKVHLEVRLYVKGEYLSLKSFVHSDGSRILALHDDMSLPPTELEVDGQWYKVDTQYLTESRHQPFEFGSTVMDYETDFPVNDYMWVSK